MFNRFSSEAPSELETDKCSFSSINYWILPGVDWSPVGVLLLIHGKGGSRQSSLNQKHSLIQVVLHHCSFGTQRLWNQMPWVTNLRTNLSKACLVLTPEGILCTRNDCCSMVCSHTMAVCCTLKTNMFLFVLYFNFFPHFLGGSQFECSPYFTNRKKHSVCYLRTLCTICSYFSTSWSVDDSLLLWRFLSQQWKDLCYTLPAKKQLSFSCLFRSHSKSFRSTESYNSLIDGHLITWISSWVNAQDT